ncbi:beta/alpha barrel domain-containing protein [Roseivirga misakiensis]|uniref:Phosphoribosylanthranilate isomerase n=1 Tax=Roseivirga misakiensis TaxID=1563681 RepID=A0A1E5T006_9BACT|nr:hypothetical protein [Roseivirga misakiensis]OEK04637.1 hypothetical protein BFP71_14370 [Roseivirga misakiensis]
MALRTFVVVSGINNLSDARYCAGMEVNELGFNIEPDHQNYTDPTKFKEMTDWLSGVEFVGEINDPATDVANAIKDYGIKSVQISHLDQIEVALSTGLAVVYNATSIDEAVKAWDLSNQGLDYIIINNSTVNSDALKEASFPFVVSEGFQAENVIEFVESLNAKGISLTGGDEIRPGYKDFDELADILEELEIDDLAG